MNTKRTADAETRRDSTRLLHRGESSSEVMNFVENDRSFGEASSGARHVPFLASLLLFFSSLLFSNFARHFHRRPSSSLRVLSDRISFSKLHVSLTCPSSLSLSLCVSSSLQVLRCQFRSRQMKSREMLSNSMENCVNRTIVLSYIKIYFSLVFDPCTIK